jgi:osmotically-inducible protein OsmY
MNISKPAAFGTLVLFLNGMSGCATHEECGVQSCASDQKITANVHAALDQHPELGAPNSIDVNTLNHVVYLSGSVSEGAMRSTAESVARQVQGVARVDNTIYVTK